MRVLVTGGAGFIGSHVTDALLARGDEAIVVDAFSDFLYPAERKRRRRNRASPFSSSLPRSWPARMTWPWLGRSSPAAALS